MFLFYIILGILQGILEWLPVSSEGQLVLVSLWFSKITAEDALSLAFWLHIGTMLSVLYIYRDEWKLIIDPRKDDPEHLRRFLIITTIATGVIGIPVKILLLDVINVEVVSLIIMWVIAVSLIVTGILLHYSRKSRVYDDFSDNLADLSDRKSFLIGCAQGFTIIPGISRSGTTVSALLFAKQNTRSAFHGSFLMSVPAALGSVVLDILFAVLDGTPLLGNLEPLGILVAIIMAFIFGLLTMHALLQVARKYNFSLITISFGLLIIIFLLAMKLFV